MIDNRIFIDLFKILINPIYRRKLWISMHPRIFLYIFMKFCNYTQFLGIAEVCQSKACGVDDLGFGSIRYLRCLPMRWESYNAASTPFPLNLEIYRWTV